MACPRGEIPHNRIVEADPARRCRARDRPLSCRDNRLSQQGTRCAPQAPLALERLPIRLHNVM
eukprot:5596943-Pyramimonas_sp.AAC.1